MCKAPSSNMKLDKILQQVSDIHPKQEYLLRTKAAFAETTYRCCQAQSLEFFVGLCLVYFWQRNKMASSLNPVQTFMPPVMQAASLSAERHLRRQDASPSQP